MSPEIKIDGQLIVSSPDKTGICTALDGTYLYIDVDGINANKKTQKLVIEGPSVGGKRVIELTQQGIGESSHPKRGDGLKPDISVTLQERPIRVSYRDKELVPAHSWGNPSGPAWKSSKRTYINPYWVSNHG